MSRLHKYLAKHSIDGKEFQKCLNINFKAYDKLMREPKYMTVMQIFEVSSAFGVNAGQLFNICGGVKEGTANWHDESI